MDWGGNSGSMQSSSTGGGGGDEAQYDSSSDAFFHVGGGGGVSGGGGGNSIQAPSILDSLSNFLITDHHNNLFSPPLSLSSSSRSDENPSPPLNLDILLQNPSATIPRTQLSNFNSQMTSSLQQSSLFDPLSNFLITDHHNNLFSPPLSLSSSSRSDENPSPPLNLDILLQNPSATIPRTQLSNFNSQMTSSLQQSSLFDPLSNFLITDHHNNLFSPPLSLSSSSRSNQNPSSSLNLDILLQNPSATIPRTQLTNFNSQMTSSTLSPSNQPQSVLPHSGRVASENPSSFPTNNSTDHQHQANINNIKPNRNPKKRNRESTRAPTTVLTTDTSNFRAMVQEFTGMPTQQFPSSSSPRNRRLDLFSNTTSTVRSGGCGESSNLLRPSAQKLNQITPFLSSSTSSMMLNSNVTASTSTTNTNPSMTSLSNANNFQLLSDQLGFPSNINNQNSLNMQTNPSLIPYQSLFLQSNPINQSNDVHRANHSSSTGAGGGSRELPNLVTSDGLISTMPMSNNSSSWENQDHILNGNYYNSQRHLQQPLWFPSNKNNQSSLNIQTNPSLIPYQSMILESNPINESNDVHRANHSSSTGAGGGSRGLPNLVTSDGLISTMPMRNNSSSWENRNYNNSQRHLQQQQMVTGNAEKGSTGNQNSLKLNKIANYMSNIYNS